MIKSHNFGNYLPITLDDEKMSINELKEEREFLQFIIDLKYYPKKIQYLRRILNNNGFNGIRDKIFKTGYNIKANLWLYDKIELINMKNAISIEILLRNKKLK